MTIKDQLQKEINEKVKPGVKPSDLKKKKVKPKTDEGYSSDEEKNSIPTPPIAPNQKIKELQTQINSLQKQLQTYKDFKEADLKIKEKYKGEIKEYKQTVKELETKIIQMDKTIEELKSEDKNPIEVKEKKPKYYLFTCDICEQHKKSQLHLGKVNGLGIDPNKENKICDWCINKVDLIKNTEQEYLFE